MAILNNLFPPIVPTYADAFLTDSGDLNKDVCKIYFSISTYNNFSDIANAQITICNQNTNISALDDKKYPCGIMITNINIDNSILTDSKYYIEIKKTDMQDNKFEINQYYKIQIRFTSSKASVPLNIGKPPHIWNAEKEIYDDAQSIDSWLISQQEFFSEWSTVILARGISTPRLMIRGFDNLSDNTLWMSSAVDIIGKLNFKDEKEKETLDSYQIKLYNINSKLLVDTGIVYTNNYNNINEINYTFKYNFLDGEEYYIEIYYNTLNQYRDMVSFNFTVIESGKDRIEANFETEIDEENAFIKLKILGEENFTGNITIRRTSSESNFTIWEDIHTTSVENEILNYEWTDYTIKSGVVYKYGIQKRDSLGNRGILKIGKDNLIGTFEHTYLYANGKQLKIKYNPQIQSFQRTVAESKIDTIGSKYPFIERNGAMDYKQFPISGTISFLMDDNQDFSSREKIYGDNLDFYKAYNSSNNISPIEDIIYEKDFREEVLNFLYENNIKLFKSATEGNILVKLMNITLTPETALGRKIYNFNCTAYEVAEFSLENCDKYNIQKIGTFDTQLSYRKDFISQYTKIANKDSDIIVELGEYYQKYAKSGYVSMIEYLDYLRIEMEEPPYLITETNEGPIIAQELDKKAYLGYIVYINNRPIVINPEGIYELKGENVKITSIYFPKDTKVILDYHVYTNQIEDVTKLTKNINYFKRIGQYWGGFIPGESVYQRIFNRYFYKYSNYFQSLISLDNIRIEADPGTVVYVKESGENIFQRHIVGETHELDFNNKDCLIEGIYFSGIHLEEATEDERERKDIPNNKYIDTGIVIETDENKNLIKNGVYILASNYIEALVQANETYKLRVKTTKDEDMLAIVLRDRIEKRADGGYNLLIEPEFTYVKDDNSIIIDENEIELYKSYEKDDLYINSKEKPFSNNQVIVDKDDINKQKYEKYIGNALPTIPSDDGRYELEEDVYRVKVNSIEEDEDLINVNKDRVEEINTQESNLLINPSYIYIENTDRIAIDEINSEIENSSVILSNFKEKRDAYELTLYKYYEKIFALILQQEINSTNKYIWYNNQWWAFTENHDLICPIDAIINYCCEIMKGYYSTWEETMNI